MPKKDAIQSIQSSMKDDGSGTPQNGRTHSRTYCTYLQTETPDGREARAPPRRLLPDAEENEDTLHWFQRLTLYRSSGSSSSGVTNSSSSNNHRYGTHDDNSNNNIISTQSAHSPHTIHTPPKRQRGAGGESAVSFTQQQQQQVAASSSSLKAGSCQPPTHDKQRPTD
ncbi:uncharacterized protein K452DRAFT_283960 [Aplosporella prunicola CBS 121167]|uniref:Uncharacterized protein n=1 Tax=Aplosporella prunicola CBS 121167 TaxID=1176127 RepID=A0A6A6BN90_9PEZI|nr:uncharacterized protein K452DRAFT_283960 [Aplosporella prunicola CBS 121167]KAF2145609.1 hypothetical protein K452DRAFT_283960 [Aplosporella prunicola CBS 121167]